MAFKFPFTNYHELNLNWVLEELKKLFEDSEENVTTIETYDERLTAVETELPTVSATAQDAAQNAAAASTAAQQATATANTAQENATQAQSIAGFARQEAQAAQTAADAATQAAQQATATAQNFDGRITQAQNDASTALEASHSFENRVQAAITTANNAANTATNAQGIAMRADQNAALALDTLNAQRAELERIGAEQAALITAETEDKKTEIENLAESVLDSIPADYTELSELVDKKAPVIINSAAGSIASFDDGADNMKIQKLVVNIEPVQAGSGEPSPTNVRSISGWTGAEIPQRGKNLFDSDIFLQAGWTKENGVYSGLSNAISRDSLGYFLDMLLPTDERLTISYDCVNSANSRAGYFYFGYSDGTLSYVECPANFNGHKTLTSTAGKTLTQIYFGYSNSVNFSLSNVQIELGATATDYEEYRGNQISVTFPSAAGTVYGGTLTLNPDRTGTLKSAYIKRVYDNTANWRWYASSNSVVLSYGLVGRRGNGTTINVYGKCNLCGTNSDGIIEYVYSTTITTDDLQVFNVPSNFGANNLDEWKSLVAETPIELVYELDTPIEYQLTASEVSGILETLYGQNNIWADAGSVSVDYPADTKLYIDGKLAELQATILENI